MKVRTPTNLTTMLSMGVRFFALLDRVFLLALLCSLVLLDAGLDLRVGDGGAAGWTATVLRDFTFRCCMMGLNEVGPTDQYKMAAFTNDTIRFFTVIYDRSMCNDLKLRREN